MAELRLLVAADAAAAADLHRRAGALIRGYDISIHTPEEDLAFHRDRVILQRRLLGAFRWRTDARFHRVAAGLD